MAILWIVALALVLSAALLVTLLKGVVDAARNIDHKFVASAGVAAAGS